MSAHRKSITLATATLQDIISQGKAMSASAMREDTPQEQQAIREKGHALLDAYFDHMADAGIHAASIISD